MVNRWFGVGQFLSGAMGQLYPGGDSKDIVLIDAIDNKVSASNVKI
jgi:hypothetical protein